MCRRFAAVFVLADFVARFAVAFFVGLLRVEDFLPATFFIADFYAVTIATLDCELLARVHSRFGRNSEPFTAIGNGWGLLQWQHPLHDRAA